MADVELLERVQKYRGDFCAARGKTFEYFFCPILQLDEQVPLCRGHIVPAATRSSSEWIPQRTDVDNFYGHAVEADFSPAVRDRDRGFLEKLNDKWVSRRTKFEHKGRPIGFYHQNSSGHALDHTPIEIVSREGTTLVNIVVKESASVLTELDGETLEVIFEHDFRPSVIASAIKAAHLTMFWMLGYSYVFSPSGQFLANVLATFFRQHRDKKDKQFAQAVSDYFLPFQHVVEPLKVVADNFLSGTLNDQRIVACFGANHGIFAMGVIVKCGTEFFNVFIPVDRNIDTYFSFIKEPPPSIAIKVMQFQKGSNGTADSWQTGMSEPIRVPLNVDLTNGAEDFSEKLILRAPSENGDEATDHEAS